MPRSLVLCPTRELAAQVAESFETYAKHTKLTKALLIGGVSFKEQDVLIGKGVDVLIATPGRLLDHFERGKLLLTGVQIMVVDEADRMLDMGFIPDIERIFSLTPFTRQTMFYSATMAPEIERITNLFLSSPAKIEVARQATASETIEQGVVMFRASRRDRQPTEKRAVLRALIEGEGEGLKNAIIFCNRKTEVDVLAKSMKKYGYDAAPIHGDLDQSQRTRTLDAFRADELRFLIASDVAARGLDIPAVSHIFNYDVPSHAEDYVHRIGRTGRAGLAGRAIMICMPSDERNLDDIEKLTAKPIPRLELPAGIAAAPATAEPDQDEPAPRRRGRGRPERRPRGEDRAERPQAEEAPVELVAAPAVPEAGARRERRERRPREDSAEAPVELVAAPAAPEAGARRERRERRPRERGPREDSVVGMGDHLPSFIAQSFEERLTG